mmetsp:Transcript_2885/g.9411  ORF Transcript_2885/g.9411 Transcript_2885/m.9411 type:complete len:236 (-) Transcript_2885:1280-1987(-)
MRSRPEGGASPRSFSCVRPRTTTAPRRRSNASDSRPTYSPGFQSDIPSRPGWRRARRTCFTATGAAVAPLPERLDDRAADDTSSSPSPATAAAAAAAAAAAFSSSCNRSSSRYATMVWIHDSSKPRRRVFGARPPRPATCMRDCPPDRTESATNTWMKASMDWSLSQSRASRTSAARRATVSSSWWSKEPRTTDPNAIIPPPLLPRRRANRTMAPVSLVKSWNCGVLTSTRNCGR